MGWCSGTEHFDRGLELMFEYVPEEKKQEVLGKWYDHFRQYDADCLDEGHYYDDLVKYGIVSAWEEDI